MSEAPTLWLMFHGTDDRLLPAILRDGLLVPSVEGRLSHAAAQGDEIHLAGLHGVYVAADRGKAGDHAGIATELRGGQPLVVAVLVDVRDTVPDEDHVLEFLGNYGTDLERIFRRDAAAFLAGWRSEPGFADAVSAKVAADMARHFSPVGGEIPAAEVGAMLDFALAAHDEGTLSDAMEDRGGNLAPDLLLPAIDAPGGLERYRALMDALCRAMPGTRPYDDVDAHSLRIPDGVGFSGRTRVVGVGTPDNPFLHYAGDVAPHERAAFEEARVERPEHAVAEAGTGLHGDGPSPRM